MSAVRMEAALLAAVRADRAGEWGISRAVRVLRAAGIHPVSPRTAWGVLQALAEQGHLVRREVAGRVRYTATEVTR